MAKGGSNTLLTVSEVAEQLGISADTVYRNFRKWKIPAVKVGGSIRIRQREIDAYLDRHPV